MSQVQIQVRGILYVILQQIYVELVCLSCLQVKGNFVSSAPSPSSGPKSNLTGTAQSHGGLVS